MKRIPASGSAGLAASALIQAALGIEFLLSGLNKFADPNFIGNFSAFVNASPGTKTGLLAPLIHTMIQPNIQVFAELTRYIELILGLVLLVGAIEVGRRRLGGRIAQPHAYEAMVALVAAFAGLATAGLSLSIALLMGEQLPTIMPGRALTTAIPVELLLIPLGIAVAWMELGRFLVLRNDAAGRGRRQARQASQRVDAKEEVATPVPLPSLAVSEHPRQ
ncbi:MAG TPA: hypothetical protein VIT43_16515 [Candidatus Dormibacteraeota bacterium]